METDAHVVIDWLRNALPLTHPDKYIQVEENPAPGIDLRLYLYTATHRYSLAVRKGSPAASGTEGAAGYLGCIAQVRTPRPGEDWTRGNDLPDGPLCRETFDAILNSIVGYELLPLAPPVERAGDEPPAEATG